jgi:thiamine biosynthesis lipoprotein
MPHDSADSSRRDFLTGRAVRAEMERAGHAIADAVVDAQEGRPEPQAFDTVRLETRAMACPWSVVMDPGPPSQVMLASDALALVHDLESQLSVYRDDTELSRINREAASAPQPVEAALFELILQCAELSTATGAAFDVAVRALILLWRRCRSEGRIPTAEEVAAARGSSGRFRSTAPASASISARLERATRSIGPLDFSHSRDWPTFCCTAATAA